MQKFDANSIKVHVTEKSASMIIVDKVSLKPLKEHCLLCEEK